VTSTLLPAPAPAVPDPLEPVRSALLGQASRDADAARAAARRDADEAVAAAREQAWVRTDRARGEGERDAEAVRVQQRARARRTARAVVLTAQREALEQARNQVRGAVLSWWDEPDLRPVVRDRLAVRAHRDLGPEAVVRDDPGGGVVAETADRRVRYLLTDLAEAVLDRLGSRLERVWEP